MKARWLILAGREEGQALPLVLVALAIGTVLVTPFLASVSVNVIASRQAEEAIADRYSADAGIEWGLWRLTNEPTLTSSTVYTETPLQPTPTSVNAAAFPTTEIRFVPDAGASETVTPTWQTGGRAQCYPLTSTDSGSIYIRIETDAVNVKAELRSSCTAGGLPPLGGTSPYIVGFAGQAAGSYQVVVQTSPPSSGTLAINYPIASYDLRSQRDRRTITARVTASTSGVRVVSWQTD